MAGYDARFKIFRIARFSNFCLIFKFLPDFQIFARFSIFCPIFKFLPDFQIFARFSNFCPIFKFLLDFQIFARFSNFFPIFKILSDFMLSPTVIGVGLHRLGANMTRRKSKYTSASPQCTCLPSRQICIGVALGDPPQTPLQC